MSCPVPCCRPSLSYDRTEPSFKTRKQMGLFKATIKNKCSSNANRREVFGHDSCGPILSLTLCCHTTALWRSDTWLEQCLQYSERWWTLWAQIYDLWYMMWCTEYTPYTFRGTGWRMDYSAEKRWGGRKFWVDDDFKKECTLCVVARFDTVERMFKPQCLHPWVRCTPHIPAP